MLNPAIEKVATMLDNGQEPSVDDLGNALMAAIKEREAFEQLAKDMAGWMSKLVAAHLKKDEAGFAATFNDFIAKHVKVVPKSDGKVH